MAETLKIIRSEHRRLSAVIICLTGMMKDVEERGANPDFELFELILTYFETFLYRFHHPKEDDYLFCRLLERDPASAEVIEALEQEHKQGKDLLKQLQLTLTAYKQQQNQQTMENFHQRVKQYRDFEYQHMGTEERDILPRTQQCFTEADWQELDAVFTAHEDPLFGDKPSAEFAGLLSRIVNQAPAPHGLGE